MSRSMNTGEQPCSFSNRFRTPSCDPSSCGVVWNPSAEQAVAAEASAATTQSAATTEAVARLCIKKLMIKFHISRCTAIPTYHARPRPRDPMHVIVGSDVVDASFETGLTLTILPRVTCRRSYAVVVVSERCSLEWCDERGDGVGATVAFKSPNLPCFDFSMTTGLRTAHTISLFRSSTS